MKKLIVTFLLCSSLFTNLFAQIPPAAFNYSAVARDVSGQPIANAAIGIQISILKTTTTGTLMYSETHSVNTDAFGLFNLVIGSGAIQSGSMSAIEWSTDNYFLQVGMDASGGTNFQVMGTTQLLSVPYALHAATADSLIGGLSVTETDPLFSTSIAAGISQADTLNWNKDNDSTNELQTLSINNDTLYLTNGGSVVLPSQINEDNDSTNELQMLSISNDTIYLTNGGFVVLPTQPTATNGGKTYIELYDDVTDAQADSIIAADLGPNTQFVYITNTTALTTVDLTGISSLIEFVVNGNALLTNIIAPNLARVSKTIEITNNAALSAIQCGNLVKANNIFIQSNSELSSISFPMISKLANMFITDLPQLVSLNLSAFTKGSLNISNTALTSLYLSALTTSIGLSLSSNSQLASLNLSSLTTASGYLGISNNPALTSLDLSALTTKVSGTPSLGNASVDFEISNNPALTSLNLSSLTTVSGKLIIQNNTALTSLNLSSLTTVSGDLIIQYNTALTTLDLSALTTVGGLYVNSNALPVSEINEVLARIVAMGQGSVQGCVFLGQNPLAPPSGQGITDKATIEGWGQ